MPDTQGPTLVMCQCGNQLGEEICIDDVALIHAGGGIWHELWGHCVQCSEPFYWSTKGTLIQRMIITTKKLNPHDQAGGG